MIQPVEGVQRPDPKHRAAIKNLVYHPNPRESFFFFLCRTVIRLKATGESHWEIAYDGENIAQELYVLEGDVQPQVTVHGEFKDPAYIQKVSGQKQAEFDKDEVIEFLMPNPISSIHGAPDLEALEIAIPADLYMAKWDRDFFINGTSPEGLWLLKGNQNPEMAERNKQEIRAAANAAGKGRSSPIVVEGDVDHIDMSTKQKDSDFHQGRRDKRQEIGAVTGTPEALMGVTDAVNRANMTEIKKGFYEDEVDFILGIVSSRFNAAAADYWGIDDWELKLSSGEHLNATEAANIIKASKGNVTLNEVRTRYLGLPPIKYGDIILVQTSEGMKPLHEIVGEKPKPVEKLQSEKKEKKSRRVKECLTHHPGCEHDVREELGPVTFPNVLMKPAIPVAKSWRKALERSFFKMRDQVLTKVRALHKANKDYRNVWKDLDPRAQTKINVEFMKQSYVTGQKEVAFKGPEDPRMKESLVEPEEQAELEELQQKPLFKIDWEIVPTDEWEILKKRASDLSEETIAHLAEGEKTGQAYLKKVLADGWKEGLTLEELEGNIRSLFDDFAGWKARRIARSETNPIFNLGRIEASERAGYELGRVSTGPRACDICIAKRDEGPRPLAELKIWIQTTHPNESCTIVGVPTPETKRVLA